MDSTKTIPWSMAWTHVAGTSSYWIGIVSVLVIASLVQFVIYKVEKKADKDLSTVKLVFAVISAFALFFAALYEPSTIAANTNYIMAAKGHFIY